MLRGVEAPWAAKLLARIGPAEVVVSEQAKLYAHAQGLSGPRYWTPVDFVRRIVIKGFIRTWETLFGKVAQRMALKLQMGDERVVAHMD